MNLLPLPLDIEREHCHGKMVTTRATHGKGGKDHSKV